MYDHLFEVDHIRRSREYISELEGKFRLSVSKSRGMLLSRPKCHLYNFKLQTSFGELKADQSTNSIV
jgi:hypothetical protein